MAQTRTPAPSERAPAVQPSEGSTSANVLQLQSRQPDQASTVSQSERKRPVWPEQIPRLTFADLDGMCYPSIRSALDLNQALRSHQKSVLVIQYTQARSIETNSGHSLLTQPPAGDEKAESHGLTISVGPADPVWWTQAEEPVRDVDAERLNTDAAESSRTQGSASSSEVKSKKDE